MKEQPEALRLANELDGLSQPVAWDAAAELRRLHAENEKLRAAMEQQEPVAWLSEVYEGGHVNLEVVWRGDFGAFPVFRRQQPWHAPLTDEQIAAATGAKPGAPLWLVAVSFIRAAEAAHGIK